MSTQTSGVQDVTNYIKYQAKRDIVTQKKPKPQHLISITLSSFNNHLAVLRQRFGVVKELLQSTRACQDREMMVQSPGRGGLV